MTLFARFVGAKQGRQDRNVTVDVLARFQLQELAEKRVDMYAFKRSDALSLEYVWS